MSKAVQFNFRIWVHPEDGDPPDIEVWWHGLEHTGPDKGFMSDWIHEALTCEDFHHTFDLDTDKHWQVVGKGELTGWYDYWGEYDESLDVIEYEKAEVPESYYEEYNILGE